MSKTRQGKKPCTDLQIVNPLTGRCVKMDGKIGQQLLAASRQKAVQSAAARRLQSTYRSRSRAAKLFDLANTLTPGYDERGYLTSEQNQRAYRSALALIAESPDIKDGDMVFIGDTYETRQEYGCYVVNRLRANHDPLFGDEVVYGGKEWIREWYARHFPGLNVYPLIRELERMFVLV